MTKTPSLDNTVIENFKSVNPRLLILPILVLLLFFFYYAFTINGTFIDTYVDSQKNVFLELNEVLSFYPKLAYNITYLGDALVLFPFVFIFLFVAPKLWEAILTSAIFTLIISAVLKSIFAVPRPAAMIDVDTFTVLGKANVLHTSLPSGHSMTAFMVITVLLYAFMPKKISHKIFWSFSLITIGLLIAFSRVAVGAHYPVDVVLGCTIGYIMAILGIRINRTINWLFWMKKRRFYPIIMLILCVWAYLLIVKLIKHNLVIFYLSLIALVMTFLVIVIKYAKEAKA